MLLRKASPLPNLIDLCPGEQWDLWENGSGSGHFTPGPRAWCRHDPPAVEAPLGRPTGE